MTAYPEITFMNEARKAGVHSFIYKSSGFKDLFFLIRRTIEGTGYYPGPLSNDFSSIQLTEKEIAVVRLAYQGKSRSAMLKELGMSEKPLKTMINSILNKTGYNNIMDFAVYAALNDIIKPV
jgi:DNA-binding NarL/FixJ family response regulator